MGFPIKFTCRLGYCIFATWYSITINGSLIGFFKEKIGLRQGDTFSPYLFILSMEIFWQHLDNAASSRAFSYHPKCKVLKITHLCFADDAMIFTDGSIQTFETLKHVFQHFYLFTALQINLEKYEVCLGGFHPQ